MLAVARPLWLLRWRGYVVPCSQVGVRRATRCCPSLSLHVPPPAWSRTASPTSSGGLCALQFGSSAAIGTMLGYGQPTALAASARAGRALRGTRLCRGVQVSCHSGGCTLCTCVPTGGLSHAVELPGSRQSSPAGCLHHWQFCPRRAFPTRMVARPAGAQLRVVCSILPQVVPSVEVRCLSCT